mmetsp:Transcript_12053/g.28805  ORF Transcript_12053/g.28805 Transcript_12053/m.28805 type:complete len:213 (-) Transcript_12053:73-711(-)
MARHIRAPSSSAGSVVLKYRVRTPYHPFQDALFCSLRHGVAPRFEQAPAVTRRNVLFEHQRNAPTARKLKQQLKEGQFQDPLHLSWVVLETVSWQPRLVRACSPRRPQVHRQRTSRTLEFQDNAIVVDGIAPLTHPLARTTLARTPLWQYGRSLGTTRRGTTPYPLRGTAWLDIGELWHARERLISLRVKHRAGFGEGDGGVARRVCPAPVT